MPATVQWKLEVNALTIPRSWRPRHVPHTVLGDRELAAEVAKTNPNYNEEATETVLAGIIEQIKTGLISGSQITLKNAFTFRISLSGRLDSPDDPLPPLEDCLNVQILVARPFLDEIRQAVQMERLPMSQKLPLITSAADTVLKLSDVLNPNGALHLTGSDLFFDQEHAGGECVLEGTRSGRQAQSRFVILANTEIIILPDIPTQPDPWNNEYIVSVSTHYTEHGTLRTGIYERKLRTPLTLTLGDGSGILTDKANSPHVTVTGGSLSEDETVRIQVLLDQDDSLLFNLIDMSENGRAGAAVKVTADGPLTLAGFANSALTSLNLTVNNHAKLVKMIRSTYSGRLVDVLQVTAA